MDMDEGADGTGHLDGCGVAEDWDPGSSLWVAGVDYLGAWRAAAAAADELNVVLAELGINGARVVVVSGADGCATVDVRLPVAVARMVASRLRRVSRAA
ncbi:hypothetical protein [Embleya sp. NPDC005971]|uniref:hypothetical protein n=1 Tax=unclassified Embleya TaxID=2699296 RepID=UPI0033C4B8EA